MEAMQDTFVQLIRRQDQMDARHPSSLLYRIATNVCLNRIRSRKRRPEDPHDELISRIASTTDAEERSAARLFLETVFGQEPESTAVMAVLHLRDGWTLEEVAEEVGLSVSGVRKRLRKLKATVAELEAV